MEFVFSDPTQLLSLAIVGVFVGFLTGLFGIGGAFITTPLMIALLGIDSSLAVGCSLGYTIGTGLVGVHRHRRMGNVEWGSMVLVGVGASIGTIGGYALHRYLATAASGWFDQLMTGLFVLLLIPVAVLTWRCNNTATRRPLLTRLRLRPMIKLANGSLPPVSLIGLIIAGVIVGVLKGLLGLGGGVILIPLLVLVVGLSPHMAVGTSLGTILLSSVVGCVLYASSGYVNLPIVLALLVGSTGGVYLGAKCCVLINGVQLQRAFAVIILMVAAFLAWDFTSTLLSDSPITSAGTTELDLIN